MRYTPIGAARAIRSETPGGGCEAAGDQLGWAASIYVADTDARIACMRERTGLNILVSMLQFGVMPDDLVKRNMEMFAAEVMPHFRDA